MAGLIPPVVAELTANISEFKAKMGEAKGEMASVAKEGGGSFDKLATVGKGALLGFAAAGVGIGTLAVKAAMDGQKAHAELVNAITQSGHSMEEVEKQVESTSKSFEHFGYDNAQVESALTVMTQATGDPKKALDAMGVAADLAAAKHMDLNTAGLVVAKAMAGNSGILRRYGIDMDVAKGGAVALAHAHDAVTKAQEQLDLVQQKVSSGQLKGTAAADALKKAHENLTAAQEKLNKVSSSSGQILGALEDHFGGSASAAANTLSGHIAEIRAHVENLLEKLGNWLIPKIDEFIQIVMKASDWLGQHKLILEALGVVVGTVLVAAIGAYIASIIAATAATLAAAAPFIAIGAAVAALVVGAMYLWNNWNQIWDWIWHHPAIAGVIAVLIPITIPIMAVVAAAKLLYDNWSTIWPEVQAIVEKVWSVIGPTITLIGKTIADVVALVKAIFHGDWSQAWSKFKAIVKDGIDLAVEWFIALPAKLLGAVVNVAKDLWDQGITWCQSLLDAVASKGSQVVDWFTGLPGKIGKALVDGLQSLLNTVGDFVGKILDKLNPLNHLPSLGGALDSITSHIPGLAGGGTASGFTVVGENGPELAYFGSPARVFSNADSRAMLGGGTTQHLSVTNNFNAPIYGVDDLNAVLEEHNQKLLTALRAA